MPLGGLLTLGAISAAPSLITGAQQLFKANSLKLQDTTTPEQREALAIARQRAAAVQMPGQALAEGRLSQGQNGAIQSAQLGAASGSDFLAASAAANQVRAGGEQQLMSQQQQYNNQAQAGLTNQLMLQAQQRQRDLAAYNQQKAAYTEGGIKNIANGVNAGASYAAYGLDKAATAGSLGVAAGAVDQLPPSPVTLDMSAGNPLASPGIRGTALPGYAPGLSGGRYRNSSLRLGLY